MFMHLVFDDHGDVDEHVVQLLDAALQPHDVFVASLDLVQGLLVDLRVHYLGGKEAVRSVLRWEIKTQSEAV